MVLSYNTPSVRMAQRPTFINKKGATPLQGMAPARFQWDLPEFGLFNLIGKKVVLTAL